MERKRKLAFSWLFLAFALWAYAGEVNLDVPITLDVKGMDILDVLKIISLRSGLSIAASPLVRGKVTIFLKDVSVWEAFEILMAANDLAYEMKGNLVTVMTNREYEEKYGKPFYDLRIVKKYTLSNAKAEVVGNTIQELKSKIGKVVVDNYSNSIIVVDTPEVIYEIDKVIKGIDRALETRVVQLNYIRAEDIKENLSDLVTKEVGRIKFDQSSNRVVITDLSENAEYIERVIKSLDKRPQAVEIEAKIIQITLNKEYQYGIDWGIVFGKEAGIAYLGNVQPPQEASGIGKIAIGEVVFNETASLTTAHQYKGLFKLFSTFGKTDVLSSPRITVLDGQEAYVLVGTREPIISVTASYPQGVTQQLAPVYSETVEYIDTGVKLSVTPYVSEEGYIKMKIKPEVSEITQVLEFERTDKSQSRYPITTTSEAETTVIVKDKSTIVLAGLMKESKEEQREKVPGLGDLPILRRFFSGKSQKKEKTELVILLTPRIVSQKEAVSRLKEARPWIEKEQVEFPEPERRKAKAEESKRPPESLAEEKERKAYSEYYLKVTNKIYRYLKSNYLDLGLEGEVNVVFLLDRNGKLVGEPAVIGDVEPAVRELAIEVVKRAEPYAPFPKELSKEREAFNILLNFE